MGPGESSTSVFSRSPDRPHTKGTKETRQPLCEPGPRPSVTKVKDTPELKDVFDCQARLKLLEGAFNVDRDAVRDKRVLLLDDLYRSGATATVVAQAVVAGGAAAAYMLAMTKTRTRT